MSCALETRQRLWLAQMSSKPKGVSKKKRTFGTPAFQHFTEFEATLGVALRVCEKTSRPVPRWGTGVEWP